MSRPRPTDAQGVPAMPDGFTDRAAWDAIHWRFSENESLLDTAVIGWQRANQERVRAALRASSSPAEKQTGEDAKV